MRIRTAICAAFLLSALACAVRSEPAFEPGAERYRFDVAVTPRGATFACTGQVTDLTTGATIAVAPFDVAKGKTATGTGTDPKTGAVLEVEVEIAPGGSLATYGAKVTKAGGLVASKRGTLKPGAPPS